MVRLTLFFTMDQFDKPQSYTAEPNPAKPNVPQIKGSDMLNPIGSNYAKEFNKNKTILIKRS